MKVAIDTSPLSSGHKIRGVGFYLKNLLAALKKYHPEHEYLEFPDAKIPKDADIIHYPYFDPFFNTLPFFSKKPTVVTVHDLTPLVLHQLFPVGLKGMLTWRLQRLALLRVKRVITDSLASKEDVARLAGLESSKIDSIYLAAGEQFKKVSKIIVDKVKEKYHLPKTFVLYVGDVTPNKNILRLVKACMQINIPLVIAGKVFTDTSVVATHPWTKELGDIREIADTYPKKVSLLGFVPDDDLVALYNSANVFAMPSLYEGFGLPVVEAFSCGTPVVCSDKGSLKEVAGNAASIIDPFSISDIANALEKVVSDAAFAKKLSAKGLERVKMFSWEKTADKTAQSYEKALTS